MGGIQQQLAAVLGVVAADHGGPKPARRLTPAELEAGLRLVQHNHRALELVPVGPEETRRADNALQLVSTRDPRVSNPSSMSEWTIDECRVL